MACPEHESLLEKGRDSWNRWRSESDVRPDLSGSDLRGFDLKGYNLAGAMLRGASFSADTELHGATLASADLAKATLRRVDLCGMDLNDACLVSAKMEGAQLKGASLCGANMDGARMREVDLREADCRRATFRSCTMTGAQLTKANLCQTDLSWAHIDDADLTEAKAEQCHAVEVLLSGSVLNKASFDGARLFQADLTSAVCRAVSFVDAVLDSAVLEGASLQDARLDRASLRRASFVSAHLEGAVLTGADIARADLSGAYLARSKLRGVEGLSLELVGKGIGEDLDGRLEAAAEVYSELRRALRDSARHHDESRARVHEMNLRRSLCWQRARRRYSEDGLCNCRELPRASTLYRARMVGLGTLLYIWFLLSGYGERLSNTIFSIFAVLVSFSILYCFAFYGIGPVVLDGGADLSGFWDVATHSVYTSVVTLTTLGTTDTAPANWAGEVAMMGEVLVGCVLMGLLVSIIAKRSTR